MMTKLPPDEVIANILHTLHNKTNASPLLISCKTKPTTAAGSVATASWDLLHSFQNGVAEQPTHDYEYFLASWIDFILSGHEDMNLGDALRVFTTPTIRTSGESDNETGFSKDEDLLLWLQGLAVLQSIISNKDTALAPHELLRTVMDSYYFKVDDHESEQEEVTLLSSYSSTSFHLPTLVAMFILRSLISVHAIQTAEISTRSSLQRSETIRWRRLKSMVDDTITLFHRMLRDGFEIISDNFENDTLEHHPMKPAHFITIAVWLYTKYIFPSCQALVCLLLEEDHGDGIANLEDGIAAKLFGMLTSLVALECTSVVSDRDADQNNTDRLVMAFINDPISDELFRYSRPQQPSGQSLEEDLLLYERPFYNKLGQATIALLRIQDQIHPSISTFPPSPLSAEYRWTLLFPHVIIFLADDEVPNVRLGFDMLQMLIVDTPFIRPAQSCSKSTIKAVQRAHSSDLLAHTLYTLLSLVLRISALEASVPNSSSILKYSSMQAANFAQKLLQLYDANVQVQAIAQISQKMRDSIQLIALLPKVLDWLRPIITVCNCNEIKVSNEQLILLCEVIRVLDPILTGLDEVFDDSTPLPRDVSSFFSMIEAYTSLFSSLRAMKMFRHTTLSVNAEDCARLSFISDWMKQSAMKLECFKEHLEKLIDFWSSETSSPPPPGHHRCFLLHYHLQEALIDLTN